MDTEGIIPPVSNSGTGKYENSNITAETQSGIPVKSATLVSKRMANVQIAMVALEIATWTIVATP